MREILERLDATPGESLPLSLAWLAGQQLAHDPDELKATLRRAELLRATGGDPRRELDLDDRAVTAVADDLDDPETRARFEDALTALAIEAVGLISVAAVVARLRAQPDRAWQCYACALLADAMTDD